MLGSARARQKPPTVPRRCSSAGAAARFAGSLALGLLAASPLIAFTPGQAKRIGPGPFAAAPIVQGGWADGDPSDTLRSPLGGQVGALFYEHLDADQGSLVVWITPEWDGSDGKRHDFFNNNLGDPGRISLRAQANNLILRVGSTAVTDEVWVDISGWQPGETHLAIGRWEDLETGQEEAGRLKARLVAAEQKKGKGKAAFPRFARCTMRPERGRIANQS